VPSFVSQLGTANSQLGYVQLGVAGSSVGLEVSIGGTTRRVLQRGTRFTLENPISTARLIVNDFSASLTIANHAEVVVTLNGSTLWRGIVIERRMSARGLASGQRRWFLECASHAWLFEHPPALISSSYSAETDQNIVIALVAAAGLDSVITATTSTIDEVKTGLTVPFGPNETLRSALDLMAELSGAIWHLDMDLVLHWNSKANADSAPWDISDDSTDVMDLELSERFDNPINSVKVVGGEDGAGLIFTATDSDATSISAYGTFFKALEDAGWITQSVVDEIADTAIADSKDPRKHVTFKTRKESPGILKPNQLIEVTHSAFGLSAEPLLIRRVEVEAQSSTQRLYRAEAGDRRNRLDALLRRLRAQSRVAQQLETIRCGRFDGGANTRGDLGLPTDFVSIQDMTVSLWIYPYSKPSGTAAQLFQASDGNTEGWVLEWTTDDKIQWRKARSPSTSSEHYRTDAGLIPLNQWTHIMVVSQWSAPSTELYINNAVPSYDVSDDATVNPGPSNTQDVEFGRYLDGAISTLAVWEDVLTADERAIVSNRPHSGTIITADEELSTNLLGLWELDEFEDGETATGTDAWADSSGAGSHATPTSSPAGVDIAWAP